MGYSVKQVSAMTGLPVSTLRYYDKMGLPPAFCLQMETGSDEMVTADSAVRKTESD
ncbi:MerR family DNA-binding transcriptional regulator [uncultured Faecalibaculum sp.]|uniref:MerR family DNA-binding transcriptional regulator n=1 Tax=uncultured Faecalibaculum sp. TaxID=1729681 RepID=UPI002608480E|nr:MerR family DNA-binding transcriptional regulator [uncultured Faecalibaculum sp.]